MTARNDEHIPAPAAMRLVVTRHPLRFGVMLFLLGLLLWAKLILVTGHPRTAIAEPERTPPPRTLPARTHR